MMPSAWMQAYREIAVSPAGGVLSGTGIAGGFFDPLSLQVQEDRSGSHTVIQLQPVVCLLIA